MSAFLSGAAVACGPSNVLKDVQGKLDRDYSLQQDRLVSTPNIAGSSRQPFRSQNPTAAPPSNHFQGPQNAHAPFDLSSLRQHLSPSPRPAQQQPVRPASSGWAEAFNVHNQAITSRPQQRSTLPPQMNGWGQEFAQRPIAHESQRAITHNQPVTAPWKRTPLHQPMNPLPHYHITPYQPPIAPHVQSQYEHRSSSAPPEHVTTTIPLERLDASQDLLAKTAQSFVDELESPSSILSANPKLAQSKFFSLLKGLGSGGIVINQGEQANGEEVGEGAKLVNRGESKADVGDWASAFNGTVSNEKGESVAHGFASPYNGTSYQSAIIPSLDPYITPPHLHAEATQRSENASWETSFQDQEALIRSSEHPRRKSVHFGSHPTLGRERSGVPNSLEEALASSTTIPGAGTSWLEEGLDDFDDETFMSYNGMMKQASPQSHGVGLHEGWGELQKDWEEFKRLEPGVQGLRGMETGDKTERYLFQRKNPFYKTSGSSSSWEMESPTLKGVLELEASVQQTPSSHEAWYNLGLKQQENEREESAILALSKTIQLEPDYRPAYLALAVSYTNESEGEAACTMLEKWITLGEGQTTTVNGDAGKVWGRGGREGLIERLIDMARTNPHEVDAEVQVALGVLFNATEEYQKAEDCFLSALSVKPDDWLLYNRLGATLANSGRSNEAIQYYHKALELHPSFVRALFNLGISYINLGQYNLAAQSALDALRLQHSDASEAYSFGHEGSGIKGSKGVTSEALWTALRTACIHMNRHELVNLVGRRDLSD
ncbi:uncharacterized protein IL334_006951 [Kwoniella shivajii]|uniref:PEX18/PEX21 C-terminal domain-containing protein n=1 Tax=Kwoniella shivajii TaxID=564305 RepID=A0ABZ1D7T8_9TREE|nr:hypothetical protein IL334_006951 [Kwoniella shivajii]